MLESQYGLDQPRHTCRCIQMADIALHRSDRAEALSIRGGTEGALERRNLDGVADGRCRAVRFHITNGRRIDTARVKRRSDHRRLAFHAGGCVAHLVRTVVVYSRSQDDGPNRIAVEERVFQALQHHDARAGAAADASGMSIERAAMAIRQKKIMPGTYRWPAFWGKRKATPPARAMPHWRACSDWQAI